jgi:hypothetical protein
MEQIEETDIFETSPPASHLPTSGGGSSGSASAA